MGLLEDYNNAKKNNTAVFVKNYFPIDVSWERILLFLYNESIKENQDLIEKDRNLDRGVDVFGNVLIQRPL